MPTPSFNVLSEPWIPVIRLDGSTATLGVRRCLEDAHMIRHVRDPVPIIEFGLARLLTAFLFDALVWADRRPVSPDDLRELMDAGRIDMAFIDSYVDMCGDVFDLFHPSRPFFQTVMTTEKPKPIAAVFPVVPSGTNAMHWHHADENTLAVSAAEAARMLTTLPPFMTAGGAGLTPSINGAPAMYAWPAAQSLFHSLILNLPIRDDQDAGNGMVAWRTTSRPGSARTEATMPEALTWRPRCIQLIPEEDSGSGIVVRVMRFVQGDSTKFQWIDPNLAYRYDKDVAIPVRMREHRPIWRDAGPLALLNQFDAGSGSGKSAYRRPDVVEHAFDILPKDVQLDIHVYGMRTDMKMKVFEWVKSTLNIPVALGRFTALGSIVHAELDRAERAAFHLRSCLKSLYPREGAGNKEALGTLVARAERSYWHTLESDFHTLMHTCAALSPEAALDEALITPAIEPWRASINSAAFSSFEETAKDMDTTGPALERQVRARSRLYHSLKKVLS